MPPLATIEPPSINEKKRYLFQLGYLIEHGFNCYEDDFEEVTDIPDDIFEAATQKFQEATHFLLPDGWFGPETERVMHMPRCPLPDFPNPKFAFDPEPGSSAEELAQSIIQLAQNRRQKWPMKDVTVGHNLAFRTMTAGEAHKAFVAGMELWNEVCGINLEYIRDLNRANIFAHPKRIDGRSGTLAWSFLANGRADFRAEQRYDTSENWNHAFLLEVACHEIGHAIGISHITSDRNAIMYPYSAGGKKQSLNRSDISEAVARYGENDKPPQPEPPKPDPPQPNPKGSGVLTFDNGDTYNVTPTGSDSFNMFASQF